MPDLTYAVFGKLQHFYSITYNVEEETYTEIYVYQFSYF